MPTFVIFESLVDRNSPAAESRDISDGTFPFPLFYETSDKFANFIMRNGLVASNIMEKYKVIKLAGEIVSLYINPIMKLICGKVKTISRSAS